jgi:hypothetical protein
MLTPVVIPWFQFIVSSDRANRAMNLNLYLTGSIEWDILNILLCAFDTHGRT